MTKVPRRTATSGETKTPKKKTFDPAPLARIFEEFRGYKNTAATAVAAADELRDKKLMPALIEYGEAHGEKGQHLAIDLPEPVDGFVRLVRRTNVSRLFDIDAAEKLLKKKGVLEQAQVVTVTLTGVSATELEGLEAALEKAKLARFGGLLTIDKRFSQDAMMAIYQRHRQELQERLDAGEKVGVRELKKYLSEEEVDGLIIEETTYAFHPEKK